MEINLFDIFDVGFVIFVIGCLGLFFLSSNLINLLISIELVLLSLNYMFVLFSVYLQDGLGQFFAICILSVAAAESAIGLSLVLVFYRIRGSIYLEDINLLKG